MLCFKGEYIETNNDANNNKEEEIDIYQLMLMGLKIGLQYKDFYEMNLVTLINLLTSAFKKKERKPTQAEIDLIT